MANIDRMGLGSVVRSDPEVYSARVRQLSRLTKAELVNVLRGMTTIVWSAAPVARWSRDEITNEILRTEFPRH